MDKLMDTKYREDYQKFYQMQNNTSLEKNAAAFFDPQGAPSPSK